MLQEFLIRCVISCSIAVSFYFVSASVVSRVFARKVNRDVMSHDVKLGVTSLLFGTPLLQGYAMAHEYLGVSFVYSNIAQMGWAYWALSVPVYVLLWDLVFYVTHRALHWTTIYRNSHFRHHSCRPPVAWSGIAVDPFETILSGILPYVVPLFMMPFHIWTVYALNMGLLIWATLLHSTLKWNGNWLFFGPKDHNVHHSFGLKNCNFAAVFTLWDRLMGTMDRKTIPVWWAKELATEAKVAGMNDGKSASSPAA